MSPKKVGAGFGTKDMRKQNDKTSRVNTNERNVLWARKHVSSQLERFTIPTPGNLMKTVVIGGGLAGVQSAYFLMKDGHQVTLLERNDELGAEASFANGGLLTPSHAAPWNSPGIFETLFSSLGKQDAV